MRPFFGDPISRFKRSVRYNLSEPVVAEYMVRVAGCTEPAVVRTEPAAEPCTGPAEPGYTVLPAVQSMVLPAVWHTVLSVAAYTVKAVHADR